MRTLILAGGFGTRLRGVVKNKPKCMIPVKGKPFLEYLILQLRRHNLVDIILSVGYLGKYIRRYFRDGRQLGVTISYSREEIPLGTGGAIKPAESLIQGKNFLVMNGDSFLDINLNELIKFHLEKKALATMALTEIKDPKRYGTVETDEDGEIKRFTEKGKNTKSNLINGGIYVFNKEIFDYIPKGKKVSLEKEIFPEIIGKRFYGLLNGGYFIDIGTPEDYLKLRENPQVLLSLIEKE